jgi:hypothetical protein
MYYPITKFLEGHRQWWYVNAVLNEVMLDPVNGWPKEKVVVSFYSRSIPALYKNMNEKHSYIPVKTGGGHHPVVECIHHNWCAVTPFYCVALLLIPCRKFSFIRIAVLPLYYAVCQPLQLSPCQEIHPQGVIKLPLK